jgi:hypothetical protein
MGDPTDPDLDEVLGRIDEVAQLRTDGPPPRGPSDPPRDRQILRVTRAALFAESSVPPSGRQAQAQATIRLEGVATGGALIRRGFIHVVPPDRLRPPAWDPDRRWLRLWMEPGTLPLVLRQLEMSRRYFWGQTFGDGQPHAELHAWD